MNKRGWALRAAAGMVLSALLAACGGGGGGSSGSSSASAGTSSGGDGGTTTTGGTASAPLPGSVSLSDLGAYPARPVTVAVGTTGSSTTSGSGSTGSGTGGTGSSGGSASGGTGSTTGTGTSAGSSGTVSSGGVTLPPYVPKGPKTLVLYDAPAGDQWEKLGFSYAIMLRNLLGHFDANVDLVPVQQYTAGQIAAHDATFYLGASYNNPLPAALIADAAATGKPLVWFKYNLWELANDPNAHFTDAHGITLAGLRGMNATPTAQSPNPGFFDTVTYKGRDFTKYYVYDAVNNVINADPDIGVTAVGDPAKASVVVPIRNSVTGEQAPYVLRSGNFWYVADMPFSYIGPRDRYLVIADLLHDMLGIQHAESHQAMVRLEDVGAQVSVNAMQRLTDYLQSKGIRFSIAVIPHHKDPLGSGNDGVPQEIPLAQATNLRKALDYAIPRGGEIVMHGYTHQYAAMKNPWTGMSGDDYEFWDIVHNTPVAEDSVDWTIGRLTSGLAELLQFNYGPVAWETPHYVSSPLASRAIPLAFSTTYQRAVYFTSDHPDLTPHTGKDFMAGQFYPYVIARDYYGQRVLPENLGNIEYDISNIDPTSYFTYTWQEIYLNAQYALTVRDGFGSFFFHPFWLEKQIGTDGYGDFTTLVQAITNLGYTWVTPTMLAQ